METRRRFLKFAAALSGAAGVPGLLTSSIQRAYAIEPEPGSSYLDAEHIVILMQENRSFDHTLGTLQGVRGFNDPRAIRLANGNSAFVQSDSAGNSYAPWRLNIHDTRITWMGSIPHSRDSQVDAWNGGLHDGWIEAKRSHNRQYAPIPITMGHYTREDLPFYYALADAFTVCDQSYCAVMTSTTPNRSYFWTGTIRDQQNANSMVYMRNDQLERGGLTWKTYPERLHEAGISWKFYQNELTHSTELNKEESAWLGNFGCNPLEDFSAYNVEAYSGSPGYIKRKLSLLRRRLQKTEQKASGETDTDSSAHLHVQISETRNQIQRLEAMLSQSGATRYKQLSDKERALHDAAFTTNAGDKYAHRLEKLAFQNGDKRDSMQVPKGDVLYQFRKDVTDGKLPTVSWLTAPERFSDHPTSAWFGAWYVSEVLDILTKNPEVWKKTVFILTYDENDGYFDHAPSFVAADPKRPETGRASAGIDTGLEYTSAADELRQGVSKTYARSGPIGMGFRIPTIVASPWSRGGWINSQLFDHTSTLMLLEQFLRNKYRKEVVEQNISDWRRCVSGDLTSVFRTFDATEAKLSYLDRDKFVVEIQKARDKEVPSNYQRLTDAQIADINKNSANTPFTAHQEKGTRPSCALPYELYVDGNSGADRGRFILTMKAGDAVHGKRAAGCPFNVYLRNTKNDPMKVATFAVKAGDTLREEYPLPLFTNEKYSIEVHGPNGFYRSFSGSGQAFPLLVLTGYESMSGLGLSGNVQVVLENTRDQAVAVKISDNSYGSPAIVKQLGAHEKASVVVDLAKSHGWYDFTVATDDSPAKARFAGRVETGRPSFSDPLIGGLV